MKIKEDQLKTIKEQQQQLNNIIHEIGLLESNKHSLLHQIAEVNKDVEEMKRMDGDDISEQEENWKSYMMSTYTNGRVDWDHRKMFEELIHEIADLWFHCLVLLTPTMQSTLLQLFVDPSRFHRWRVLCTV